MKRLILVVLIIAAILAPLELLGFLRKSADKVKDVAGSPETQSLVERFKIELPNLGEKVNALLKQLFPKLNIGAEEVR
jgi:hypothetical protein